MGVEIEFKKDLKNQKGRKAETYEKASSGSVDNYSVEYLEKNSKILLNKHLFLHCPDFLQMNQ